MDQKEAREVGRAAVKWACQGRSGSVAIKRAKGKPYKAYPALIALKRVAGQNRVVPGKYICPSGNDICPSFRDWCLPLVGGLPKTGGLD